MTHKKIPALLLAVIGTHMKTTGRKNLITLLALLCGWSYAAQAADFTVTTPNSQFQFRFNNSSNSPTLTLVRGRTYTFAVNTTSGFHPFRINSPGVSPNNISSGTITYTVPLAAQNYTYDCGVHGSGMAGQIITVPPPAPPVIGIAGYSFTNQLVLRTTGSVSVTIVPEYNTNLNQTNWSSLTVLSNRLVNGTNEVFCGRPPVTNVFVRVRATQN